MLPKNKRLRNSADFAAVYKQGKYVVSRQLVLYYRKNTGTAEIRVGFVASKKLGASTVRNRCKRLLREAVRRLLPEIKPGYDLVLVSRPSLKTERFQNIVATLARLLRKAGLMENKNEETSCLEH